MHISEQNHLLVVSQKEGVDVHVHMFDGVGSLGHRQVYSKFPITLEHMPASRREKGVRGLHHECHLSIFLDFHGFLCQAHQ